MRLADGYGWRRKLCKAYGRKFISKNIDGFGINCDIDGGEPTSATERINVCASTGGIGQFQQIGACSVSLWQELRRLDSVGVAGELQELQETADRGKWDRFITMMGDPTVKRCPYITGEVMKR